MKPSLFFYASGIGMIAVALLAAFFTIKYGGSVVASFLLLGGLAWIISVGLKFAWAIPTNKRVIRFFEKKLPHKISGLVTWAYFGLLTGLFECGIALLFVIMLPLLRQADSTGALSFGVGFGAAEALLLGFFSLVKVHKMKEKDRQSVKSGLPLLAAASVIDRTSVLFVHAFTKVLIVLAVQQSNYALFWLSFGFKSLLDAIAAFGHLKWKVLEKPSRLWVLEVIVVIFGLVSLFGLWLLRPV